MPSVEPGLVRCCSSIVRHGVRRCNLAGRTGRRRDLGQPEIQNLGVAALGDEDVGGLDVAMNDPLGMRGIQRVGNLDRQTEHSFIFHGLSADAMLQRHALQKLHGNERLSPCLADFVDGANIGMIQRGSRPRLPPKTFQGLRVFATSSGRNLRATKRPSRCLRPCRPRPSRRRRAFQRCGSARWCALQWRGYPPQVVHLTLQPTLRQSRHVGGGRPPKMDKIDNRPTQRCGLLAIPAPAPCDSSPMVAYLETNLLSNVPMLDVSRQRRQTGSIARSANGTGR